MLNTRTEKNPTFRNSSLILIFTLSTSVAIGQQLPSAGSQSQQVRPAPQREQVAPELKIERPQIGAQPASDTKIVINAIRVTHATHFSEQELITISRFKAGEALTLTGLYEMASRMAEHYRSHGYFLAQAFVPPQDIKDGVVTIEVMEGRYGNVRVRNQSRLSDSVANKLVADLRDGDSIAMAPLESSLLLLSDLPGVEIRSTLTPGSSVGAADLIVDVVPGRLFSGNLEADNFGSRYTGEYRFGGTGNLNDPFGYGDVASLRVLSSFDGFSYGRASYQFQIDRVTIGAAYTALDYELGEEFKSLLAHGTAEIASLYSRYPLLRQRNVNLNLVANLESKQFKDELEVTIPSTITRKKTKSASVSLLGERKGRANEHARSSVENFSLTLTSGQLDLLDAQAVNSGASPSANEGHYDKLGASVSYLHALTTRFSWYASARGQWSPDDLDVSEKMSLGGTAGVRAYPEGEAYVDEGFVATTELRLGGNISTTHLPVRWELVGFADLGKGRSSTSAQGRTLSGVGIGVNGSLNDFLLRTSFAHRIGPEHTTSVEDSKSRFWIDLVKFF